VTAGGLQHDDFRTQADCVAVVNSLLEKMKTSLGLFFIFFPDVRTRSKYTEE